MPGAVDEVPQELVADKYRLTRLLGRGGMGSVWEGVHTSLGTRVAVKFIDAGYADNEEARSRFKNEALAAAKLRSKHVVQVYDHGMMDDGRLYIVMEYLAGEPLDRRLDRVGTLSLQETAHMTLQVCRALSKAHEAGIVHRDLKPENVFLVWDDEDEADIVKVVDFGIAKFTDPSLGPSSATRTGSVLGTPYYMSPEQARGLRSVDFRSDLWSIGVIAFRCVVGQLPFEGEATGDLLVKICTAPLPLPSALAPGIPPAFDTWFTRALAREPDQRFGSASELAEALLAACGLSQRVPLSSAADASGGYAPATTPQQIAPSGPEWTKGPPGTTLTGAPTAQTPLPASGSRRGLIVAVGAVAVLVLGVAVVYKLSGSAKAPAHAAVAPSAAVSSANSAVAAGVPAPGPDVPGSAAVVPAPALSLQPTVEPVPSASAVAPPTVPERKVPGRRHVTGQPRHKAVAPHHKPATHKRPLAPTGGKIDVGY